MILSTSLFDEFEKLIAMNVNTDPDFWNWILERYDAMDIVEDVPIEVDDLLENHYDKIYNVYGHIYRGENSDEDDES